MKAGGGIIQGGNYPRWKIFRSNSPGAVILGQMV